MTGVDAVYHCVGAVAGPLEFNLSLPPSHEWPLFCSDHHSVYWDAIEEVPPLSSGNGCGEALRILRVGTEFQSRLTRVGFIGFNNLAFTPSAVLRC